MSTSSAAPNSCPKCGAALPSAATAGICPRCLMAEAMVATQGDAAPSAMGKTLSPAELAPHFPQLEILECLGRGGMGVVYKARQKSLNRFVALKLLAPERVANGKFAERFTHEAQALAALNHPSIVTIYDFGQAGGFYFLLMEFVDGVNLRQAMKAGRFTPEQALAVVPPVCEALQYAHEHGIVHRDIKPENLLLDREGRVKIADFGIAKMLGGDATVLPSDEPQSQPAENEGTLASAAGTPQYMAPEQKEHRRTDHRADIYSLGVVLYELLTGELPAEKLQPPSSRLRGVQIDVRLDEIVLRALETKPELRYQTASEFRTQVETVVSTHSGSRREADQTSGTSPRVRNASACYVSTPEQLGTFDGQFFLYRRKSQAVLDDRHLAFIRAGTTTVIPLAAIRDLSIGHYPRVMNPAGLDLISVTYGEGGHTKRLFFSPSEGLIGSPWRFNQFVGEWFNAIRDAVTAATGRAPGNTPAEQLGMPSSSKAIFAIVLALLAPAVGMFMFIAIRRQEPNAPTTFPFNINPLWAVLAIAGVALLASTLFSRRTGGGEDSSAPGSSPLAYIAMFFAVSSATLAALIWSGMIGPSRMAVFSVFPSALLGVILALPVRRISRGKQALLIGSLSFIIWAIFAVAASDGAQAQIHTRVFEVDAKLVDELVPGSMREPGQFEESKQAVRIGSSSRAAQAAEISADVFTRLLEDGANPPGMLHEEAREGTWWPKVATNSQYMRHGMVAGGGNLDGFLGLRRQKGVLQLRVECSGIHGMNSAYQVVKIGWEGGAPPPGTARAFFIPVSRMDGAARYLVIAVELGNGTESAGGISNVHTQERKATIEARLDGRQELRVFAGQESLGWSLYESKAGPVTATVEASSQIRLEDGSLGKGFIIRAGGATSYVAITPNGPVPFGELVFRKDEDITARDGSYTFADLRQPDGVLVPISIAVRRKDQAQTPPHQANSFGPVIERVLPSGVPCREQYFQFRNGEVFVVGNGPGTSKDEAAYDEQKIDDAGGVDMSAGSSEDQIHISGRGCIFTRDFWDKLKWDSFSAEQAVYAIKRARDVDGVVTPTKKELPITYLFKTANGEVGLMEVLGVVDDQRDGWKEKGMMFRYKLVQGTGRTTASATTKSSLVFGPETQGLQAAIEVTPGEPIKLRIHVRNASDRGISIGGALYRQDDECLLTDAQGEPVPVTKVRHDIKIGMKDGYFGPGQVAVFECADLSFQEIDKAPASAGYVAKASPGRYTLRFRLRLPGEDVPFTVRERDWKGELETAPVTIEVKDPSTQPIEPRPKTAASPGTKIITEIAPPIVARDARPARAPPARLLPARGALRAA